MLACVRPACANPVDAAGQLVMVTADSWNSPRARMRLYVQAHNKWTQYGQTIMVELGRSGLAWGRGLHTAQGRGPIKQEGDNRSPAGIFRLETAFGYASQPPPKFVLPYRMMTSADICVDDPNSPHYNQIFDASGAVENWSSHEAMRRKDGLYQLGIIVEHNTALVLPDGGSCIFLHVRRAQGSPTVGCTAMSLEDLTRLATWLDPAKHPLLVQLPKSELSRFQRLYALPGESEKSSVTRRWSRPKLSTKVH